MALTVMKFPIAGGKVMPFILLISSTLTYLKLSKNSEITVMRAAGISSWRFTFPSIITAFIIGIIYVLVINPLFSYLTDNYVYYSNRFKGGGTELAKISSEGLWLRHANYDNTESIINAKKVVLEPQNIKLTNVTVFNYDEDGKFKSRIDSNKARLIERNWILDKAIVSDNKRNQAEVSDFLIATTIVEEDISNRFISHETVPFWSLPDYIDNLENSGFSGTESRIYFHNIISSPLYFVAMVIVGVLFSLPRNRNFKYGMLIMTSVLTGFFIYLSSNLIFSLAIAERLPVILAAWAPIILTFLIGIIGKIQLEESR